MRVQAVKLPAHVVLWTILMALSVVAMVLASSLDRMQAHAFVKQVGTALLAARNARLGGGVLSVIATVLTVQMRSAVEKGIASMALPAVARAHATLAMEVPFARLCALLPMVKLAEEAQKDIVMSPLDLVLAPEPAGTLILLRQLSPLLPVHPLWQPSGCQTGTLQQTCVWCMTEVSMATAVKFTAIHGKQLKISEPPPLEGSSMLHATALGGTCVCRTPSAGSGMAQHVTRVLWDTVVSFATRNVCAMAMGHAIDMEQPALVSRTRSTVSGLALIVAHAVAHMAQKVSVLNCRAPSPELIPSCLLTLCSIPLILQLQAC